MKKVITIFTLIYLGYTAHSQPAIDSIFRIKQVDKAVANNLAGLDLQTYYLITSLERNLDSYKKGSKIDNVVSNRDMIQTVRINLSVDKPKSLENSRMSKKEIDEWLKKWKVIQYSICIDCYENEIEHYVIQKEVEVRQQQLALQKNDSLRKVRADSLAKAREIADSISNSKAFIIDTSYDARIIRLMIPFAPYHRDASFTTFCGVRLNFAMNKIGWYMYENMGLTDTGMKSTGNKLSITYIPRISTSNQKEYITITYTFGDNKHNKNEPIIKQCDITGTSSLILTLFLNYWGKKVKIDDDKLGEIVYYDYLSDRVSLIGLSKGFKIEIRPNGNIMDYENIGK